LFTKILLRLVLRLKRLTKINSTSSFHSGTAHICETWIFRGCRIRLRVLGQKAASMFERCPAFQGLTWWKPLATPWRWGRSKSLNWRTFTPCGGCLSENIVLHCMYLLTFEIGNFVAANMWSKYMVRWISSKNTAINYG